MIGWIVSCGEVWLFYPQNILRTFAVEQKEKRKRVESVRQFCEGCFLWYSREC